MTLVQKIIRQGTDKDGKPEVTRRLVYLGRRISSDHKESIWFLPFMETEDQSAWVLADMAHAESYRPKKFPKLMPGAVVETTSGNDSSIRLDKFRFVEMWDDEDARLEWASRDAAEHARFLSHKMAEKARNQLWEQLEPIRAQYRKSVGHNRVALFAEIIRYITS